MLGEGACGQNAANRIECAALTSGVCSTASRDHLTRQPMQQLPIFLFLLCACSATDERPNDTEEVLDTEEDATDCVAGDELCNGLDDDCDGLIDEDAVDASVWYTDSDGDGFGQDGTEEWACSAPESSSAQSGDCDDSDSAIHPGADERCNERDDDCDDEIDEDVIDSEIAYQDSDGDGYGDPATALERCPVDDELVLNGNDCDDSNPTIHPEATELCNDIDDDCDASTGEEGTALWHPADGSPSESWTETLSSGTSSEAVVIIIEEAGQLDVCPGTWEATFRVRQALEVFGKGSSPEDVVFDGTELQGVVIARTDTGADVTLRNLTLTGGAGVGAVLGEFTAGGGIECIGERTLSLSDVILRNNTADVGAGLFADGCTVEGDHVVIYENQAAHYGGGLALLSGNVHLERAEVHDNVADFGGGLAIVDLEDTSPSIVLESTAVYANTGIIEGGASVLEGGALSCLNGSFLQNIASQAGGVLVDLGGQLSSDSCDWGIAGTSDDNQPSDIRVLFEDYDDYGAAETFTCDEEGCQ
jgi:hypothetical protein